MKIKLQNNEPFEIQGYVDSTEKTVDVMNLTAAGIGALPSGTHIPDDTLYGTVIGRLHRSNVSGSGNISINSNSGQIPTMTESGTFTVAIYMISTTASYGLNVTHGSNTYSLSTTNGVLYDVRSLTLSSGNTWSATVQGSVAANTELVVTIYKNVGKASTIGAAAITNNYADLDGKPTIPTVNNATLTIQKEGTSIGTFTANASSASTVNVVETDPVFSASAAAGISSGDISSWNAKQAALTFDNTPTASSDNPVKSQGIKTYVDNNQYKIYLGTSDGPAANYNKVATTETFPTVEYDDNGVTKNKPVTGIVVGIKYSASNTYKTEGATYTLNVNSTGAWPMYYNNAELATSTSANTLVAGYANRYTYYIFNGTQWVFISASYDTNSTYSNVSLGQGWTGTSSNGATATARTASLSSYALTTGGIVSVKFSTDVAANATLNINSKGAKAIYGPDGTALKAGIIKAGDVVTFIYSTYYRIISIQRGYGGYETPIVTVAGGSVTQAMYPNTLYKIGTSATPCTSLTFTMTAGNSTVSNYYHAIVITGANMTFSKPNTVAIGGGKTLPTFTAGGTFEFGVLENIMYFSYTEA